MATSEMSGKHHILTVLVENKFGVLSRVAGLFARRGFNIVSLAVSPTEDERFSRMTIVVDAESAPLEQITKQLNKLIPVLKIAILNNAYLGMVRQWQELFYGERYSEVYLSPDLPDYVKWAEAMGCVGLRAETPEDVVPTIEKANEVDDRPVVIDFRTDYREKVYPMVAAGSSNDDIILGPATDTAGGR